MIKIDIDYALDEKKSKELKCSLDVMKVLLDSLIPTTITYVLGCVLVNISELLRDKSNNYVFNIFTKNT